MKAIKLTLGQAALCDDCDFEELNQFKWHARKSKKTFYAVRNSDKINGKRYAIRMHHQIIGKPPKELMTDHRNGCGTDNRRKNLRFVTNRQNCQNIKHKKRSSKYPGISWYGPRNKWVAMININGKTKNLGYSINEKEAFELYKKAVNALGEKMLGE